MLIDDLRKVYYSLECDVPKGGNKCDDCKNKAVCLLTIKTYNEIKKIMNK